MESFRTAILPKKQDWDIGHQDSILMLGSCFTNNIGERLEAEVFDVNYDLFGTIFNPASIVRLIERAVADELFVGEEFFEKDGLWQHFELNHTMANTVLSEAVKEVNVSLLQLKQRILSADYIILTYGTAWVYEYKETGNTVANCHKLPGDQFDKKRLDLERLVAIIQKTKQTIEKVNQDIKFIFTVSPVRHWKDGATQNSVSKSLLRVAIENSISSNTKYFPAFEIMMDDLRDYRFYKKDMLHPNEQAVEYIYNFFGKSFFDEKTIKLNDKIGSLKSAQNHRPINESSDAHQRFTKKIKEDLLTLWKEYPFLKKRWQI